MLFGGLNPKERPLVVGVWDEKLGIGRYEPPRRTCPELQVSRKHLLHPGLVVVNAARISPVSPEKPGDNVRFLLEKNR